MIEKGDGGGSRRSTLAARHDDYLANSRYYVQFRSNTLGKGMNSVISAQLWVKLYHYRSSKRVALALNNSRSLICH